MATLKGKMNRNGAVPSPVVETWDITKDAIRDQADDLNTAVMETVASLAGLRDSLARKLVPFLCNLWQGERKGIIDDPKAFLASVGFQPKAIDGKYCEYNPLTLDSCYHYYGKVRIFMDKGYTREDLHGASLPNVLNGAAYAGDQLTSKGTPSKTYVRELQTLPGQKFKAKAIDGKFSIDGKPKGKGKGTPRRKNNGSGEPKKLPTESQVISWGEAQADADVLRKARDSFTKRIRILEKRNKKQAV